jgi:Fe-S-cluster containining protein
VLDHLTDEEASRLCQACGACCATSASWPRFTLECDEALAQIPEALVAADLSGMRCDGDRCAALRGEVGRAAACGIYEARPDVCRDCMPGDPECLLARERHGLAPLR